jgi:hypothetical protein
VSNKTMAGVIPGTFEDFVAGVRLVLAERQTHVHSRRALMMCGVSSPAQDSKAIPKSSRRMGRGGAS